MMFTVRSQTVRQLLYLELAPLAVSFVVAERFFKFHNFLLEAIAFLCLWAPLRLLYTRGLFWLSRWTRGRLPFGQERFLVRQSLTSLGLAYMEMPPLVVSLMVAGTFFKFGSFTREVLAFLVFWYVVSIIYTQVLAWLSRHTRVVPAPEKFIR